MSRLTKCNSVIQNISEPYNLICITISEVSDKSRVLNMHLGKYKAQYTNRDEFTKSFHSEFHVQTCCQHLNLCF